MKFAHQLRLSLFLTVLIPFFAFAELQGEALHSELVITAIKYDTLNQRCRGVSAAKNESKVNRLFLKKYGVTFNNYIKTYLSVDPRDTINKVKNDMFGTIAKMGGCQTAHQQGLEKQLRAEFRDYFSAVERSTWFPEVTNL